MCICHCIIHDAAWTVKTLRSNSQALYACDCGWKFFCSSCTISKIGKWITFVKRMLLGVQGDFTRLVEHTSGLPASPPKKVSETDLWHPLTPSICSYCRSLLSACVCVRWAQSIWLLLHATLPCFVCVCIKSLVFQCGIRVSASSSSVIVFDIRLKFCWKASFGAFDTCETLSCCSSWSLALSCVFFHNRFQHFGHKECIRVCVTQQYCALYGFRTNGIWLTTLAAANNNRPAISHHAIATVCVF